MKKILITDVPLYNKDNVSTAIRVAETLYPEGVELFFPQGVYKMGPDPIRPGTKTSVIGESEYSHAVINQSYQIKNLSSKNKSYGITFLENIWIPKYGTVPYRRNRLVSVHAPEMMQPKAQISWMEFLKSF